MVGRRSHHRPPVLNNYSSSSPAIRHPSPSCSTFSSDWDADDEGTMSSNDHPRPSHNPSYFSSSHVSNDPPSHRRHNHHHHHHYNHRPTHPPSRPSSVVMSDASACQPRRPTLAEILSNTAPPPWTLSAFMAFLSQNHCLETLEFTMDASRYQRQYEDLLPEEPETSAKACEYVQMLWRRLLDAYIVPNGPREVNLPCDVRDQLLSLANDTRPPPPRSLEAAVKIIYDLMAESVLVPFLNSLSPSSLPPTPRATTWSLAPRAQSPLTADQAQTKQQLQQSSRRLHNPFNFSQSRSKARQQQHDTQRQHPAEDGRGFCGSDDDEDDAIVVDETGEDDNDDTIVGASELNWPIRSSSRIDSSPTPSLEGLSSSMSSAGSGSGGRRSRGPRMNLSLGIGRSSKTSSASNASTTSGDHLTDDSAGPSSPSHEPMTPPTTPPTSDAGASSPRLRTDRTWRKMTDRLGWRKKSANALRDGQLGAMEEDLGPL